MKRLLIMLLLSSYSFSNFGKLEIDWNEYVDFSLNRGKYEIGNKNINVYKENGELNGTIEVKMPNFDGVSDAGNLTFWSDPQALAGAKHVKNLNNFSMIERHLKRRDLILSSDFDTELTGSSFLQTIIPKYSNLYSISNKYEDSKLDFYILKSKTLVFDGIFYENIGEFKDINKGDLLARVGNGINIASNDKESKKYSDGFAGGLNILSEKGGDEPKIDDGKNEDSNSKTSTEYYGISLNLENKTALDSGTRPGDSGSPLFAFDKKENIWKLIAVNSGGDNENIYLPSRSTLYGDVEYAKNIIKNFFNNKIENISSNNLTISKDSINLENNEINLLNKSTVFSKDNLVINIENTNNIESGRLEFEKNTTINGGILNSAGIIVHRNANVEYNAEINKLTKIGEGTLKINGKINNTLELGSGLTILNSNDIKDGLNIKMAMGASLKIDNSKNIEKSKIYFGHRGGNLDLNGHSLSLNDIYHLDKNANILNSNLEKKSIFKFSQDKNRVYLGSFNGNMDVEYIPNNVNIDNVWNLRGNIDINGDLKVLKGNLKLSGDNVITGTEAKIVENVYYSQNVKATNINVYDDSSLIVERGVKLDSNIHLKTKDSKLKINALGRILEEKKASYQGERNQYDINRIEIKGSIDSNNSKIIANIENNNELLINSSIKENSILNLEKNGDGKIDILDNLGTINLLNNMKLNRIINSGIINIEDKNIDIENYTFKNNGKIILIKKEENSNQLNIFSENDINLEVNIDEKLFNKNKKIKLGTMIGNVNLLNNKEKYKIYKEKNNMVYILGINEMIQNLDEESIIRQYLLTIMNNQEKNINLLYKDRIESSYIFFFETDKISKKNISNGIKVSYEKNFNLKEELNLAVGLDMKYINNITKFNIEDNNYEINSHNLGAITKIGTKYKFIDISLLLGLESNILKDLKTINLIQGINLKLEPKFKINENLDIKYINDFSYTTNPLMYTSDKNLKYINPISLKYETGIGFINKKIDFYTLFNIGYNFTNIKLKDIESDKKIFGGMKIDIVGKINDKLNIKSNLEINSKINTKFSLGIEYNIK